MNQLAQWAKVRDLELKESNGEGESSSGDEGEGDGAEGERDHETEGKVEDSVSSTSQAVEGSESKTAPEFPVVKPPLADEGATLTPSLFCLDSNSFLYPHHTFSLSHHLVIMSSSYHVVLRMQFYL